MFKIKLLTLNTHSLLEDDYQRKINTFVDVIAKELPNIIALQEVNQSVNADKVSLSFLDGYTPADDDIIIRSDNHVYNVVLKLQKMGIKYYWTWLPIKCGYQKFDEGIALLSLSPITNTDIILLSRTDDYYNWKTRKALGITTKETGSDWFYSIHMGWWNDNQEPFSQQLERLQRGIAGKEGIWLMGDFNNPAEEREMGYDMLVSAGWHDTFTLAETKSPGITVPGAIDGWHKVKEGMRIDQVWFSKNTHISRSEVIFNGDNYPVVSDHFGVMVTSEEGDIKMKRSSGVLLSVSSLASSYGIGCFSRSAYEFVDFLKSSGQSFWQILPLCPTSYGDSPYQSFSTFAGNPYFISLEELISNGLITNDDLQNIDWSSDLDRVDYEKIYKNRYAILWKAFKNSNINTPEFQKFCKKNKIWLDNYSLFMAVKEHFGGKAWNEWDEDIRTRQLTAIERYEETLSEQIDFQKFMQYHFFIQWESLKAYANYNGIKIIGDIPIYVAYDSADTWANPELFQLMDNLLPRNVAGCPPDGFSKDGQLWGNPLYEWDYHKATGFSWWIDRLNNAFLMYDVVRIDHFRGFDEYYSIPFGARNARHGKWEKGPGIELFSAIKNALGEKEIIAEDLGFITPTVKKLLSMTGFPGMKVLEFAFDARDTGTSGDYLPHNYPENSVCYTGTHDNQTLISWFNTITPAEKAMARAYLSDYNTPEDMLNTSFISLIMRSGSMLSIVPMQDWLNLDDSARMNTPSTLGGNWQWRLKKGDITKELSEKIYSMTKLFGRL